MMLLTGGCSTFDRGACGRVGSVVGAWEPVELPRPTFDRCIDWWEQNSARY